MSIFNPLKPAARQAVTSGDDKGMRSESAIYNDQVGICPKCKKQMGRGKIADGSTVFYCETDRVSAPLPNDMQ